MSLAVSAAARDAFWTLSAQLGIPFLILVAGVGGAVHVSGYSRPRLLLRVTRCLASRRWQRGVDDSAAAASRLGRKVWWAALLLVAAAVAGAALLVAWGASVAARVSPVIVGAAVLLLWPAALTAGVGIGVWRARGWRLDPPPPLPRHGGPVAPVVCAAVSLAALLVFLLYAVISSASFAGMSWVFAALNMVPVVRLVFMAPESRGAAARRAHAAAALSAAAAVVDPSSLVSVGVASRRALGAVYGGSLCVLVAYGVLVSATLGGAQGAVAWGIVVGILFADCVVWLLHRADLLRSPARIAGVCACARAALVAFGSSFWLLGHALLYVLVGGALVATAARARVPDATTTGIAMYRMRPTRGGGKAGGPGPATNRMSCSGCPGTRPGLQQLLRSPEVILGALTVAFAVLLVVAGASPGMARVPLVDRTHAQYEFGVGAIVAVLLYGCGSVVARLRALRHAHLRLALLTSGEEAALGRALLVSGVVSEAATVVAGGVIYGVSASLLVLLLAVFGPPVLFVSLLLYERWVRRDFTLFRPASERLDATSAASGGTGPGLGDSGCTPPHNYRSGGGAASGPCATAVAPCARAWARWRRGDNRARSFPSACARGGLPREDYATLGGFAALAGCLLTFALLLWRLWPAAPWVGPVIACSYIVVAAAAWASSAYFNTLRVGPLVVVGYALSGGVHVATCALLLGYTASGAAERCGVLAALFGAPGAALLAVALSQWRDNKWVLTPRLRAAVAVSQALILSVPLLIIIAVNVIAGVALLTAYVLCACALAALWRWASAGFFLSTRWRAFAKCVAAAIVAPGVVAGLFAGGACGSRATRLLRFVCVVFGTANASVGRRRFCFLTTHHAQVLWCTTIQQLLGLGAAAAAGDAAFQGWTVSWGCLVALCGLASYAEGAGAGSKGYVLVSQRVFPVLQYDPARDALVPANRGPSLAYAALAGVFLWGVVAAVVLAPVYIGLSVAAGAVVAAMLYTAGAATRSRGEVAEALEVLDATVGRVQEGAEADAGPGTVAVTSLDELLASLGAAAAARAARHGGSGGSSATGTEPGTGGEVTTTRRVSVVVDPGLAAAVVGPAETAESGAAALQQLQALLSAAPAHAAVVRRCISSGLGGSCGALTGAARRAHAGATVTPVGPPRADATDAATTSGVEDLIAALAGLVRLEDAVDGAAATRSLTCAYFDALVISAASTRRAAAEAKFREFVRWCRAADAAGGPLGARLRACGVAARLLDESLSFASVWTWPAEQQASLVGARAEYEVALAAEAALRAAAEKADAEAAAARAARAREAAAAEVCACVCVCLCV
jgi:hypothetical protein